MSDQQNPLPLHVIPWSYPHKFGTQLLAEIRRTRQFPTHFEVGMFLTGNSEDHIRTTATEWMKPLRDFCKDPTPLFIDLDDTVQRWLTLEPSQLTQQYLRTMGLFHQGFHWCFLGTVNEPPMQFYVAFLTHRDFQPDTKRLLTYFYDTYVPTIRKAVLSSEAAAEGAA